MRRSIDGIARVDPHHIQGELGSVASTGMHLLCAAEGTFDCVALDNDVGRMSKHFLLLARSWAKDLRDRGQRSSSKALHVCECVMFSVQHGGVSLHVASIGLK